MILKSDIKKFILRLCPKWLSNYLLYKRFEKYYDAYKKEVRYEGGYASGELAKLGDNGFVVPENVQKLMKANRGTTSEGWPVVTCTIYHVQNSFEEKEEEMQKKLIEEIWKVNK